MVKVCMSCDKWYKISGSVRGECFRQKKKITMYNEECPLCPSGATV